jgi:hypothetical protein
MPLMTLARLWRRQLCAASSVALIVPSAIVAALVALALGGGFGGLGVLGQIFAGPSIPNAGPLVPGGSGHAATRSAGNVIPVIPVARFVGGGTTPHRGGAGGAVTTPRTSVTRTGVSSTGGAIGQGGVTTRPVTQSTGPAPAPVAAAPAPSSPVPAPSTPGPSPTPAPRPTPVDTVVKTVTSVTSQLPAPAGSVATQAVQSAGSAADGLLP